MKVLVTGAAGFIGMHLALRLKRDGVDVAGCDNFDPYYDVALKHARAQELARAGVPCETLDLAGTAGGLTLQNTAASGRIPLASTRAQVPLQDIQIAVRITRTSRTSPRSRACAIR